MNWVSPGIATHVFVNDSVIFGRMKVSINTTIISASEIRMMGYIIAPRIFDLSSMLSRRLTSSSPSTLGRAPVFSPTSIREMIRGSKYFLYCFNVSDIESPWSRFKRISLTIIRSFGFFICLYTMENADLRSIPLERKLESLLINPHISFGAIPPKEIDCDSFLTKCPGFFPVLMAYLASLRSCWKRVLSKVPSGCMKCFFRNNIICRGYIFPFLKRTSMTSFATSSYSPFLYNSSNISYFLLSFSSCFFIMDLCSFSRAFSR